MSLFWLVFKTDLLVALRVKSDVLHPLAMFVLLSFFCSSITLALSDDAKLTGVGLIWLVAMVSNLLALESLFARDDHSGVIDQYLIHGKPLFVVALARICSRWIAVGLPICIASPFATLLVGLTWIDSALLFLTLLLATPVFTALSMLGAALSIGVERGGVLLAILILPIYIPVFLLGVGIGQTSELSELTMGPILWLLATAFGTLTISPFAIAASLKVSQEY